MRMSNKKSNDEQSGFTLIEAVIAILIMTIGLIGTAAAISYALQFSTLSRNVSNAKLVVVASIEEIEALRNSRQLEFKQIENVGNVNNNNAPTIFDGFSTGFRDISINPGPDGVNGTNDDLRNPGADGIYGTGDDFDDLNWVRSGYRRQITITNLNSTLKKIEVKVQYLGTNGSIGELTGVCYLNDETHETR
ncbi:hypothetical protein BH10ACI1_BH10ACI1_16010 [soil metagenome]